MIDLFDQTVAEILGISVKEWITFSETIPESDEEYIGELIGRMIFDESGEVEKQFKEYYQKHKK